MKYELLVFVIVCAIQLSLKSHERSSMKVIIVDDNESILAITGSIFLRNCTESDLLLIPGIGDTLAREIYRARFELSTRAYLDGMEQALLHAKGIGDKNANKFAHYLR